MFLAFGEIMLRIGPPGVRRFRQCLPGEVEITFGGGEANVCGSLAYLGRPVRYVTALPKHDIADSVVAWFQGLGIDTRHILRRSSGRLGIYFVETGANQRPSKVTYDREYSAISRAAPDEYAFDAALEGVSRVHVTGITPSISENGFLATLDLVRRAAARGASVSCDLNYRAKLWRWRPGTEPATLARECMSQILEHVKIVIGNEEDADKVLGIKAQGTSVERGQIDPGGYEDVARQIGARFPSVSLVAITLRESLSADHNNWGAMLYEGGAKKAHFAPLDSAGRYQPYEIRNIVDRVGAGDSFAAGLLYALDSDEWREPARALAFAVAASCLKHSIAGDLNYSSVAEIKALMGGAASGRVQR